jgi:regulator of sirC expression with transglutaminase-like and TPR domain
MLFLARRLDLPLVGVNMPVHFLLMYTSGSKKVYLDPFDDCSIVSLDQCAMFLKHNDIPVRPEYFQPCDEMDILRRFLRNLVNSYEKADDSQRVERLQHLLSAVDASLSF